MTAVRIVSLVPNGTEILFAVGAGPQVVGVSHECDFPAAARRLPQLTASALSGNLSAAEVDAAVSAQLAGGESLYTLDEAAIAALVPDLILTQNLCPVCAVSSRQVEGAIAPLARCPEVLSLDPRRLDDVFEDVLRVGEQTGCAEAATALVASLRARLAAVAARHGGGPRLGVAALEWLDPPFVAGHWVPEMVAWAGGRDLLAAPGDPSRRTTWEAIAAADPDVVLVMPCGFDEAGARAQVEALAGHGGWRSLRAVREGRAFPLDANGLWSRPGPRVVDGVEQLGELLASLAR